MLISSKRTNSIESQELEEIERIGHNTDHRYFQSQLTFDVIGFRALMIHEYYRDYNGNRSLNVWLQDYDELVCIAHVSGKQGFLPANPNSPGTLWYDVRATLAEYFNKPEFIKAHLDIEAKPLESILVKILQQKHVLIADSHKRHMFVTIRKEWDLPSFVDHMFVSNVFVKEEDCRITPVRIVGQERGSDGRIKGTISQVLFNRDRIKGQLIAGIHKHITALEIIYEQA